MKKKMAAPAAAAGQDERTVPLSEVGRVYVETG